MAHFPNKLVDKVEAVDGGIGSLGDQALASLREKGFTLAAGLTEYFAGAVGMMGRQPHIREYCPKDATDKRFATLPSTTAWLNKGGGRGMFLLLSGTDPNFQLEGYAWGGIEPCEQLPDHPITSAFRIGDRSAGKGLGRAFTQAVVAAIHTLYGEGEGIGAETWSSNHASGMYERAGFESIAADDLYIPRPTLDPNAVDGEVLDRRLYLGFRSELFNLDVDPTHIPAVQATEIG